jgi:hypothetical protein
MANVEIRKTGVLVTACTQPGCTGSIVDGYCDVCGSPAGATPLFPAEAAASRASATLSDEPGLTAVGLGSGVSSVPKSEDLDTACTQPECTGRIVDGYCDVCGSPAVVVPFVPAEAAASTESSAPADEAALTAGPALTPASASVDEEIGTQRIPGAKIPTQQLSPQERADPGAAGPGAVDAQMVDGEKVDPAADDTGEVVGEKELADDELDDAQNYRTRVAEAELPHDVREAAMREVGKLERTGDESPESGDIRTWLDTILDLPWSTKTADWIDVQESREVEATLRELIKPAVADVEEGDTADVEPVAADLDEEDTADVEPVAADLDEEDTAKVDTAEGDTKEIDRQKELAGNGTDGSQDVDTRVEEAQLPDDVRLAALREVGMLERISDQSPESDDIRNGLDMMLDLPWSTEIVDSIDIEGSRDVEVTLQGLIKPAVADVDESGTGEGEPLVADLEEGDFAEVEPLGADLEEGDTAKVDPVAADSQNGDRAPAGPHDDDTIETPAVLAGLSGREHPPLQLPEQQVVGPVPVETPTEKRRFRSLALAATALAALLIGALIFGASRDGSVTAQSAPTVTATATATVSKPTNEPSDKSTGTGAASPIQLRNLPESGRASQTVRINGRFRDGPDTFLRVQRWEDGKWLDFPLITKTDKSGRFTAFVELGGPGRYQLRVLDPNSLVTSETFVLVIKG